MSEENKQPLEEEEARRRAKAVVAALAAPHRP